MTAYIGSSLWERVGRLFDTLTTIGTDDANALKSLLWKYEDAIEQGQEIKFRESNRERINKLAASVSGIEYEPYLEGSELAQAVLDILPTS